MMDNINKKANGSENRDENNYQAYASARENIYSAHVELAKAAIRAYVQFGKKIIVAPGGALAGRGADSAAAGDAPSVPCEPYDFSSLLRGSAGVFVSIKKSGALRGCIGTIAPTKSSLAEEIVDNAISACSRDPRFMPITADELGELTVSVDVLSEATPVESPRELDVKRYGVIVSKGYRRGLLLPNLEGVDSIEEQIHIALSKAGIRPSERYDIERFEVVRYELGGVMGVHS